MSRKPFLPVHGRRDVNSNAFGRITVKRVPPRTRLTVEALEDRTAPAVTLPDGFANAIIASGMHSVTKLEIAPDGRIFVSEQTGAVRVVKNGQLLPTPFIQLDVNREGGEHGLYSVVFDPNFNSNHYVYIYYTAKTPTIHNRVIRVTANGDVAQPGSEVTLLDLDTLQSQYHMGGQMAFGPDGKLYISAGDNVQGTSQRFDTLLGKLLRINRDGSIPTDNPYYNSASGVNRAAYAIGFRNPFSFAIQQSTGRLYLNDVGEAKWEEVNNVTAGKNYGWPGTEGYTSDSRYVSPVYAYQHGQGPEEGCAVVGAGFYNPPTVQFPSDYVGDYFFADFCTGWIRRIDPANFNALNDFASGIPTIVDLEVGRDGSLYYIAKGTFDIETDAGYVGRIDFPTNKAPTITLHPANRFVAEGQPATFTVSATGAQPLSYQWQRNGVNISGATSSTYTISSARASDNGARFRAIVRNSLGTAVSREATLTVTTNKPPTATITLPVAGTRYNGGQTFNYSGTASDPETGSLPASAFTWRVDFYHIGSGQSTAHVHPVIGSRTGSKTGSFTIASNGETSVDVWYRIILTVKDSAGLTYATYRDLHPNKATITLTSVPSGVSLKVDGQPVTTPYSFVSVVGMFREIEAPIRTSGASPYIFTGWSDAGTPRHQIKTPAANRTYRAAFRAPMDSDLFVGGMYHDLLDRASDPLGAYEAAGFINAARSRALAPVATFFLSSHEYRSKLVSNFIQIYLDRTPDAETVNYWATQLQQGQTDEQVIAQFIGSAEYFQKSGGNTSGWTNAAFRDILDRNPTSTEVQYYTAELRGRSRQSVALTLLTSGEYRSKLVIGYFQTFLSRTPDGNTVTFWASQLASQTDEQVIAKLVGSTEYFRKSGNANTPWAASIYQDLLGRTARTTELATTTNAVLNRYTAERRMLADSITASTEYERKLLIRYYDDYLGRLPTDGESAFWVGQLNAGVSNERVQSAIIGSPEYFQRHGSDDVNWVKAAYRDILGRDPESRGLEFTLYELRTGVTRAAVALRLLNSPEYWGRLVTACFSDYLRRHETSTELRYWGRRLQDGVGESDFVATLVSSAEYFRWPHTYP